MPLITLTPGQFTKKFPEGKYTNYLSYLAKHGKPRGMPHATPTGKLVDLPMSPDVVNKALLANVVAGGLDPKQMRQQATQTVNDTIRAALGDLRGTTAAAQKQATDQARAYEGFAKMLAQERRTDAGYVQDLYRDAASDQARFASGITGAVGDAARADAAAQQADIAAATGQTAGYHAPDPGAMQSVGYFLGGQLPAARLSENAVYAGENALRQGLASASRLGLESAGLRGKSMDLQAELARQKSKLIAGRAPAIREAMKGISDDQRANLATLANVLYLQNAQAKTTADTLGTFQGQPTVDTYVDAQGRTRKYNPNTHTVKTSKNGTQFLAPLPAPVSSSATPRNAAGLTPSQQATQDRALNKALQAGRSGMLSVLGDKKGPLYNQPPFQSSFIQPTPKSYAQARAYLMTNYANDLIAQYPEQEARILQTVDEVLASRGFAKGSATRKPKSIVVKPSVPTRKPPGGGFRPPGARR
jgi:hypothetical protein